MHEPLKREVKSFPPLPRAAGDPLPPSLCRASLPAPTASEPRHYFNNRLGSALQHCSPALSFRCSVPLLHQQARSASIAPNPPRSAPAQRSLRGPASHSPDCRSKAIPLTTRLPVRVRWTPRSAQVFTPRGFIPPPPRCLHSRARTGPAGRDTRQYQGDNTLCRTERNERHAHLN